MGESEPASKTVDIVDDDPAVRESLSSAIEGVGLAARTYASAEAYLAADRSERAACLVIDHVLPQMDGLALVDRLSAKEVLPPVIAISGEADAAAAVRYMERGAMTMLEKPFAIERLQSLIAEAVRSEQRRVALRRQYAELADQVERLTSRERAVLDAIAEGQLNKSIATDLHVSVRTIESDRARVVEKLASKTTGQAIARYSRFQTLTTLGFGASDSPPNLPADGASANALAS